MLEAIALSLMMGAAEPQASAEAVEAQSSSDPAGDRGLLFPSASTLSRHHWQVTLLEGLAAQGTFAISDSVQVSLLIPLVPPFGQAWLPSVKVRLWRSAAHELTALAAFGFAFDTTTRWYSLAPGAAVLFGSCLDGPCRWRLDAQLAAAIFTSRRGTDGFVLAGLDASLALLGHLRIFAGLATNLAVPEPQVGLVLSLGARVFWSHFAVDLGLILPVGLVGLGFPKLTPAGTPLVSVTTGG